jgi:hypothetical protein
VANESRGTPSIVTTFAGHPLTEARVPASGCEGAPTAVRGSLCIGKHTSRTDASAWAAIPPSDTSPPRTSALPARKATPGQQASTTPHRGQDGRPHERAGRRAPACSHKMVLMEQDLDSSPLRAPAALGGGRAAGVIPTAAAPPAGTRLARPQCPRQAARTARSCLQLLADENRHARPTVRPRAPPKLLPALHDFWRDVTNPAHEPRKLDGVLVPSRPTPRALRRRPDTLSDAAGIVQLLSVHDKWSISIYTAEGDLWANAVDEHTPKCEWISCHRLLLGAALGTATPQASGLTVPLLSGTSWQPFLSSDHGEQ